MGKYSGFQTVRPPMRAVVIGGGFIGLETAENLVFRGFDVTVVEMADQVLTPLDPEYGRLVGDFLEQHGVHVALGDGVAGFEQSDDHSLTVSTQAGKRYPADLVILALGVRPDTTLARMAGIEVGELGGIRVDEHMRTSDPDIFAVGDAVEVKGFRHRRVEPDRARRAGEPPGADRGRSHHRARLPLPRHAGDRGRRAVRLDRRLDRREREDARAAR